MASIVVRSDLSGEIHDEVHFGSRIEESVSDDLNTARILPILEVMLANQTISAATKMKLLEEFDALLGLNLTTLNRVDLRLRPVKATITEDEIEAQLLERKKARTAKDFGRSDAIRDDLTAAGVEVMDGDPLGWDWKLALG